MICHHLDYVGNHLQSSAMSAADVADFLGISDEQGELNFRTVLRQAMDAYLECSPAPG